MDTRDIILPKCFGYFATISNRPPHIHSLCAFTTIHEEWKKSREGLVSFIMSVFMRLMIGERSPYEVDNRREESILKCSCIKLQIR